MTIIADVFTQTDALVNNFVTGGYAAAAAWASPAIYAGFTLMIMVMGFMYLHSGRFDLTHMAMKLMKGGIIIMLATQWGVFSTWVYNGLYRLNDELGATLMSALGAPATGAAAMETAALRFLDGASALISRSIGFPPDWSALFSVAILLLGLFLLIGYAVFVFIFAKVAFAITIVLAPIFIPFAMFEATRDILSSWARTVIGFAVIPLLASVVIAFSLSVLDPSLAQVGTGNAHLADVGLTGLMAVVFAFVMWQVPSIGAGLVGSIGVSGAGSMASMFMTPLARGISGASYVGGKLRDRANERLGAARERGRQRQLARMQSKARQD